MGFFQKAWNWLDDRSGISDSLKPLMDHPVPPGAKWTYVFGSATLFCFLLQVVTGVSLSLMYQPSSETAYTSLQYIENTAVLGHLLRGIHYFGASTMILMVGIHMIRVYINAAYKYPREMSWISGVVLLVLTIMMGFTGQLLRWDSNGVWSSIVAAEQLGRVPFIGTSLAHLMMGGQTIGGQSLSRFYAYHVFMIPALLFVFVGFHLFLVIRNGISEPPKAGRLVDPKTYRQWYNNMLEKKGVPFWPNAAWRDTVFGAVVVLVIVALAWWKGAPELTGPPDPSMIQTVPRPDWYLLWIFALFALMPHNIESYVIFLGPILVMAALLALPFISNRGERSPIRRPWAIIGVICVIAFISSLWVVGRKSPWSPNFKTKPLPAQIVNSNDSLVIEGSHLFYKKGCQYCHAISGMGGHKGPDLTSVALRLTPEQLKIRIVNGGNGMPAFGGSLSDKELNRLVDFLSTRK